MTDLQSRGLVREVIVAGTASLQSRGFVRETVVAGTGTLQSRGSIREIIAAATGVVDAGGVAREALVGDTGQAFVGGVVRETLLTGIGVASVISATSSFSSTLNVTFAPIHLNAVIEAQSKAVPGLSVTAAFSQSVVAQSGVGFALGAIYSFGAQINGESNMSVTLSITGLNKLRPYFAISSS